MKKIVAIFAVLAITLGMTSCGNNEKKQEENKQSLVEKLKENFSESDNIIDVELYANDYLNASLSNYSVIVNQEDKIFIKKFDLEGDTETEKESMNTIYKRYKPLALSAYPLDKMTEDYEKCHKILKDEFTGEDELDDITFYSWRASSDAKGKIQVKVTANATIKSEGTYREGRNIVTNYYEFVFEKQDDGSMKLLQE